MKGFKIFTFSSMFFFMTSLQTDSASQSTTKDSTPLIILDSIRITKQQAREIIKLNQAQAESRLRAYVARLQIKLDSVDRRDSLKAADTVKKKL